MIIRRLLAVFAFGALMFGTGAAWAQGAFPAPLPNQSQPAASPFPPVNGSAAPAATSNSSQPSAFPPVNGQQASLPASGPPPMSASGPPPMSASVPPPMTGMPVPGGFGGPPANESAQAACIEQFGPLREETEKRGKAIQTASARKASPQEACKLIGEFSKAELRFVNFVATKQTACGIPANIPKQMKAAHAKTEELLKRVCAAANAPQGGPAGPSLSDVIGGPVVPEATPTKKSGGSTFDTLNGNVLAR